MTDIVERLRKASNASSEWGLLMQEAAVDIEFLRKHAGAITRGPSFSDLDGRNASRQIPGLPSQKQESELTSELRHQTPQDDRVND
jgi:hypothetical protein